MRLAAERLGGFYAINPAAVDWLASFVRAPGPGRPWSLIDICAGQGAAIVQLGALLGCAAERLHAIELDESRAAALSAAMPEGSRVLAPASFFGCKITGGGFSAVYCNPPFSHSYVGRTRVEDQFLTQASDWLVPGGILLFVCPEDTIDMYSNTRRHLCTYYDTICVKDFPAEVRPYREVLCIARKRHKIDEEVGYYGDHWDNAQVTQEDYVWTIPESSGPKKFIKFEPTERELTQMLLESPLRKELTHNTARTVTARPPLPLGMGHVALLLASGHLDGVVTPEGGLPHVVRGSAQKEEYTASVTETENKDKSTTVKTVISERINLVVRTVDLTGEVCTFGTGAAAAPGVSDDIVKHSELEQESEKEDEDEEFD